MGEFAVREEVSSTLCHELSEIEIVANSLSLEPKVEDANDYGGLAFTWERRF
jgi:hypothetical protein